MKASLDMALEPLRQVVSDICAWEPKLTSHMAKQVDKLASLCTTRGVWHVLMIELPKAGKHLDKCLSEGYLLKADYPHTLGSIKVGSTLFSELYCYIFDGCAAGELLREDSDPDAVFFLRTLLYMYKKVEMPCSDEAVASTVKEYLAIDDSLRVPSLPWNGDPDIFDSAVRSSRGKLSFLDALPTEDQTSVTSRRRRLLMLEMDRVSSLLSSLIPQFRPEELMPRHGPGAVADLRGGEDKYTLPTWSSKLEHYFPQEYYAYSSEEVAFLHWIPKVQEVIPARLMAVPKDLSKPRLITVEPTANQFLQQGLLRWFRKTLPGPLRACYDFKSQEPSRAAALQASIDGLSATVDLSSASDRLSCWAVERVFSRYGGILPYLYATRSSLVSDSTDTVGFEEHQLRKFAGQGSAVTFPVQSIVYSICCIAAVLVDEGLTAFGNGNILRAARKVRVFGDDLFVPVSALSNLVEILELLQLKVNDAKTHRNGRFRESCGMDAFLGTDVTPLYLTSIDARNTPRGIASWVDVSNNAYSKGLWRLADWMDSRIPSSMRSLLPINSVGLGCITRRTYMSGSEGLFFTRESKDYHRPEVRGLILSVAAKTKAREDHGNLLQYFLEYEPDDGNLSINLEDIRSFKAGYCSDDPFLKLRKGWVPI